METKIRDSEEIAKELNDKYVELWNAFQHRETSDLDTLQKALGYISQAVEQTTSSSCTKSNTRATYLMNLTQCHGLLFDVTGSTNHLEESIRAARLAVETVPNNSRWRPLCHVNLSDVLSRWYLTMGAKEPNCFLEALDQARSAVATADTQSEYFTTARCTLAARLGTYFEHIDQNESSLDEAIQIGKDLVRSVPETDKNYGTCIVNLAADLQCRYQRYGKLADLKTAKEYFTRAIEALPSDSGNYKVAVKGFAGAIHDIADITGQGDDVEDAIRRVTSIENGVQNEQELAKIHHEKSRLYNLKYRLFSDTNALDLSVRSAEIALCKIPKDSPLRSPIVRNLSNVLRTRAELQMSSQDFDTAIGYLREYLDSTVDKPAQRERAYIDIGNLLSSKYSYFGGVVHLEECLDVRRKILDLLPRDHKDRPDRLHDIAVSLRDHFKHFGEISFIDESIKLEREAIETISSEDLGRARLLDGLSYSLSIRYRLTGNSQDLEEAVKASELAVALAPAHGTSRATYLNGLSNRLQSRFSRTKDRSDIDRATAAVNDAIRAEVDNASSQQVYLTTLSNCLASRYDAFGESLDLDQSIEVARKNIKLTPSSNPRRIDLLHNLGLRLQTKYFNTSYKEEKLKYLNEAHDIAVQCVDSTLEESPDLPGYLTQLANRQLFLAGFMEGAEDEKLLAQLRLAASTFERGFSKTYDTPLGRITNGEYGGYCYLQLKDFEKAGSLLSEAVNLFRHASPLSLEDHDRQRQLRGLSGISSLACTAFLEMKNAEKGLEILEAGRGIMANIAIGNHADLADVREADPSLQRRYITLRDTISKPLQSSEESVSFQADLVAKRTADLTELESVEARIRSLPGLERFNQSLSADDFKRLAALGPVIAFCTPVNLRCNAIIITSTSIEALPLPNLVYSDIKAQIDLVVGTDRLSTTAPSRRGVANKKMKNLLEWTWDKAIHPVLQHLSLLGDKELEPQYKPRVWWVTSGPMGLLPLHAAGKGQTHPLQNAYTHVISSYIPSFSSLAFARQCQAKVDIASPSMALITMPQTPGGLAPLTTDEESHAVHEAFSTCGNIYAQLHELRQPSAKEVLGHIMSDSVDILHLACHAEPNLDDPANTALLFGADPSASKPDPVPVSSLRKFHTSLQANRRPPRLAYLSACCTAQQYDLRLIDENIHLASAFQLIGFPSVCGTLWEADDAAAVIVAKAFYEELFRLDAVSMGETGRGRKEDNIARAMDFATGVYRRTKLGRGSAASNVLAWGSFIHIGA